MPRHRLTAQTPTRFSIDTEQRPGSRGQHRAVTSTPIRAQAGALAVFAGAIGLAAGGAASANAHPTSTPPVPALPSNITLPENVALPSNLKLPPQLDELTRDLLRPNLSVPGRKQAMKPTNGTVTSGYGSRWGTHHYGVDIAAKIGTPVYAVTDGVVLESGPASGFGQWIRVSQDDGTTGVFGHVDQSFVHAGQHVQAGQQIGTVGNRGESTGPHLHYEVWDKSGSKINPQVWLNKRGVHP
ncbi:M23 family metallopeptidase [Gordonia desulfuricans]|uniref:M23 family metallopeptidase n=1 Tax=Gordonia desulfuricans TaxID=89051 RepID=A0A7K3LTG6_9ACTN|nr:M23 family metallopeptidase [Gordonia desulfuricans]NDK91301.1 M23 family metallopeptidase [Gordonia desulfuricans]